MNKDQLIELFECSCLDTDSRVVKTKCDLTERIIDCISTRNPLYRANTYNPNLNEHCYIFVIENNDKFFIGFNSLFIEVSQQEFQECDQMFNKLKETKKKKKLD